MQTISTQADTDRSYVKLVIVALLGIVSAFGTSYFLKQFLVGNAPHSQLISFGCAVAYLIVFVFQPILVKANARLYLIVVLETVALLSVWYGLSVEWLGAIGSAVALLLLNGSRSEKEEVEERVKFKITKIIHHGLRNAMSALSLFAALVYVGNAMPAGTIFSLTALTQLVAPVDPIVSRLYPGVSLLDSFNADARAVAAAQLAQLPEAKLLTDAQKNVTIEGAVQKLRSEVSKMLGEEIQGNDSVARIVYEVVNKKFAELTPEWQRWVWILFGVLFYFTVRSVGLLIAPLISFLVFVLFKIMVATKFTERFLEPRSREFVVMR